MTEPYSPAGQGRRQQTPTPDSFPASSGPKPAPTHLNGDKSALTPRIEATKSDRRRRRDDGPMAGLKLAVPEGLKEQGFEYRWVNDDGRRVHDKTVMDDWDRVMTPAIESEGEGTPVKRLVGKQEGGAPLYAYLCRKPTEFYQEDKSKEQRRIKEQEDAMKRGPGAIPGGLGGSTSYVPGQGNQIE